MAKNTRPETPAEQLKRHMDGSMVAWGRNPLDTTSKTPSQNDPPREDRR